MHYTKFRIQNFKGIKDATVQLDNSGTPGVYAFVGLNESGKTTLLEAIHSFSPDYATGELVGGDRKSGVPIKNRVPRHQISSFTGQISVEASVALDEQDIVQFAKDLVGEYDIVVKTDNFPKNVVFKRYQNFSGFSTT